MQFYLAKIFKIMTTKKLQTFLVSPPSGQIGKLSFPLTFFDMLWLHFHPIHQLIFYKLPYTKEHLLDSIIPKLKESLSLALSYYLPLAGNFLYPLKTDKQTAFIHYETGDSVTLIILESEADFEDLTGNHPRDADQFYDFVPQWSSSTSHIQADESVFRKTPVLALQITLFPGKGICIGITSDHIVCDANALFQFINTWASITKSGQDLQRFTIVDRSFIKDPLRIDKIYWDAVKDFPFTPSKFPLPTKRVRANFTLNHTDITKLKHFAQSQNPDPVHYISTFAVASAYAWVCFVKSGEQVEEDEFFTFPVDSRGRVDPPVPANYIGNCLVFRKVKIGHQDLIGKDGFVLAVTAITEEVKRVNNKDELLRDAEKWMSIEEMKKYKEMRSIGASGSPKFDFCGADFGWGRAKKFEIVSIDGENYAISILSRSGNESGGGLELGLSLSKERMERFASIFANQFSTIFKEKLKAKM